MVRSGKSQNAGAAPEVTPRSGARRLDAICPDGLRRGLICFALPGLARGPIECGWFKWQPGGRIDLDGMFSVLFRGEPVVVLRIAASHGL